MSTYNPEIHIQNIAKNHIHGADWLSNEAIRILIKANSIEKADSADVIHERLWDIGVRLANTRPSMSSIANKIGYLFNELDKVDTLNEYRSRFSEIGNKIINNSSKNRKLIAEHLEMLAKEVESIFTYSYSSTVLDVIREIGYTNILITESRPMLEGRQLAKELGEEGFEVLLVVDGAAAMYIESADICLLGADSVQFNGSVINKVGSKLLGYAAKDQGIPLYILCDTYKFNVLNYLGDSIILEEKDSEEVSEPLKNVTIKNPYFEVIPPKLITGVITEEGFMEPLDIRRKMESMRKYVEPLYIDQAY
jgi:translation initiation factor 2B subunit (eIF-2B alpha/beta/delta family)